MAKFVIDYVDAYDNPGTLITEAPTVILAMKWAMNQPGCNAICRVATNEVEKVVEAPKRKSKKSVA